MTQTTREHSTPLKTGIVIAVLIIVAWAISGYLIGGSKGAQTLSDVWAPSESLFGGLAFAGVIYAILLQRDELRLQRKELRLTRQELKEQRIVLTQQTTAFEEQNFESTFFQLLRLQADIVNAIDRPLGGGGVQRGRDCMNSFHSQLRSVYINVADQHASTEIGKIEWAYNNTYERYESDLGHYFRNLYHIVKFVDGSDVIDKRRYTNLVRAQLSSPELGMLFYNCLSSYGTDKFRPLVERYGLLKNMSDRVLLNASHRELYDASAFRGRA